MSNIYAIAPQTSGKVVLHTTVGDIEIELWAKETPKACRNFVQLCMERYYDDCIFYRVVKDFIVQTGDPTGEGGNGESIYGKPFPNEIHSRLRFNQRGIVAMVNGGTKENTSEFFITLTQNAAHLNGKNTIFGKVVGDSFFNALKMNDFDLDEDQRPIYPAKITGVEVLWDPFEDIIPRTSMLQKRKQAPSEEIKKAPKAAKKDLGLLSFGDEEDEGDEVIQINSDKLGIASRPSNTKKKKKKIDVGKVLKGASKQTESESIKKNSKSEKLKAPDAFQEAMLEKMRQVQEAFESPKEEVEVKEKPKKTKDPSKRNAILLLEQERMKYKKKQTLSKQQRQQKTLESLAQFKLKLKEQLHSEDSAKESKQALDEELMYDKDYDAEDDAEDVKDPTWMANKLKFTTPIKDPQLDNYSVFDPLAKAKPKSNLSSTATK